MPPKKAPSAQTDDELREQVAMLMAQLEAMQLEINALRSQSERSEREPLEPELSEPESCEPEMSWPESCELEPSQPESCEPEPSQPESREPEPSEPACAPTSENHEVFDYYETIESIELWNLPKQTRPHQKNIENSGNLKRKLLCGQRVLKPPLHLQFAWNDHIGIEYWNYACGQAP